MSTDNNDRTEQIDLSFVDKTVQQLGTAPHLVLDILQAIQTHYGYLPQEALRRVSDLTEITPASIAGVSTFYSQFRHSPAGKHKIQVCIGTACHVKGAQQVYEGFKKHLGIGENEDTDSEKNFTVEKVACLGCCTLAPAVQISDVTYGHVTADTAGDVVDNFLEYLEQKKREAAKKKTAVADIKTDQPRPEVRVSLDSCCIARGCGDIWKSVEKAFAETGINAELKPVGCVGMCDETPILEIAFPNKKTFIYSKVSPDDVKDILLRHFKIAGLSRRLSHNISKTLDIMVTGNGKTPVTRHMLDVRDEQVSAFLNKQKPITTLGCNNEDPLDIDAYIQNGGFKALENSLKNLTPDQIIEQIESSQLRGRGGAGFPAGLKWQTVAAQSDKSKFIICNGDEGDPGAFMDRMLLESCPFRIIEGMLLAAYAVNASQGYFYVRAEYPVALKRIREALKICRERNLIGNNILQTKFNFNIEIKEGAGAFVCGEETALLAAIEGRRGTPNLRPPYPAQKGLWGKPTLINNVETFATVPWIIGNGPESFTSLGTNLSKGTKVFSLAGKIARGALIEVPMGIPLIDIVEKIGGGVPDGRKLKAVQIGGPSGGCIPAHLAHTAVDYEDLTEKGVIMGSGGLVVLDDTDCMVDIARYFLEFTQDESCGKCTFCRIGTRRMLDILERLCTGYGKDGDIELLEQLSLQIQQGSLCGLGKTAPTPVISTIEHFRDEYQAHIDGNCPAGKCKALIEYSVTNDCIGCTLCAQNCPAEAIQMKPYEKHEIDNEKCTRCDACRKPCPQQAIVII